MKWGRGDLEQGSEMRLLPFRKKEGEIKYKFTVFLI